MKAVQHPAPDATRQHPSGSGRVRRAWVTRLCMLVAVPVVLQLAGCGFALRKEQTYAFDTVGLNPASSALAQELAVYLKSRVRPVVAGADKPQATIDILTEDQNQTVVGTTSTGLVREYLLQLDVRFQLRNDKGQVVLGPLKLWQQRYMSYSETTAGAKGEEANLLFKEMRQDIAQQILYRLAAVHTLNVVDPD
ncbi:hypothetical protein KIK84_09005 [Curvibacter sp. CHRR-16]|uniref:LPS-assembly lipoprotein LptE n=1 Tax=Curvibacter sp. CHRR-16 TaxID=2835872 RepID=UPI001BDAC99E|nr:LPS assembly lipoprotein LptE [Curvibacter sp. CHRR-16]MBT0570466.1 hypothetical protein [Curvibacter sp. CHRR-16]